MDYSEVKHVIALEDINNFGGKGKIFKGAILKFEHIEYGYGMVGNKEQLIKIGRKWKPYYKNTV